MDELVRLVKAVADKNRLRILNLLRKRKMCVCELAFVLGITQPAVSKHLKKLNRARVVGSEQDHFWTNYYLKADKKRANTILSCLGKWFAHEPVMKKDLNKLKRADRRRLCCKQ